MLTKPAFYLGALFGLTATGLGAYGAHGLVAAGTRPELVAAFNTAVQYQFYHGLALLVTALLLRQKPGPALYFAALLFVLGTLLFCGSIYALVLLGTKGIGFLTPLGGVCFMAAWLSLLLAGRSWLRS